MRRWQSQWRLLISVTAVAVLACTLVTSLVLLISATEQAGVRGALAGIGTEQSQIDVRVLGPRSSLSAARASLDKAVQSVFGDSATVQTSGIATSELEEVNNDTFAYLGDYDSFTDHVSLTTGSWPTASTATSMDVAIPEAGARSLGLAVGSTFPLRAGAKNEIAATVVGIYRPHDPKDDYWLRDLLGGRGDGPYGRPGASLAPPIEAIGPLISSPGAIDLANVPVTTLDLQYQPSFARVTVEDLVPLGARVAAAEVDIPTDAGTSGGLVYVSTQLSDSIAAVTSGLAVTRSTVVVVALLLAILAIAAMAQTAQLFTDVRADERRMLRSRGASGGRLLGLGLFEAIAIGLVTAAVSPPVAVLVYAALAAQAPMVAAKMPAVVAASSAAWLAAGAVALLLVLVLIAPLLLRSGELVDVERARPRRFGVFARSGLDLGIVAIAGVAFWQLSAYRSPVAESGSLAVDPVLAAGPAVALLACALVCVRLIPFAARTLEQIGQGGRGALAALVGWEIGRRTRRATTTVLALSLALAVGTFALSFLATWRQSQVDQASVAVGAPVRIEADPATAFTQSTTLSTTSGVPQAATHRLTRVVPLEYGADDSGPGISARVLGLTAASRSMLDRGRLAEVGGGDIATRIKTPTDSQQLDLGRGVVDVGVTVTIAAPGLDPAAATATVTAIVENTSGLLATVDLGTVPVDGASHQVAAAVTGAELPVAVAGNLSLSGIRVSVAGTDADDARQANVAARVMLTGLTVTRAGAPVSVTVPDTLGWSPVQAGAAHDEMTALPGLAFTAVVPAGIRGEPAIYALVGWKPVDAINAVVPASFARDFAIRVGDQTALLVNGYPIPISVVGQIELVPGSALVKELGPGGAIGGADPTPNVVVDERSLARKLLQSGYRGVIADEWWIDVAPDEALAYVKAHPGAASTAVVAIGLQQAPLRVATQAALWLAIVTGGLLAAVGFAVQTAATMRQRRLEFAQLQAIGLGRSRLVGVVAFESLLLVALGSVFGIGIGLALAWLVGPLVAVSTNGKPPVPDVIVEVPWAGVALLVGTLAVALVGIVGIIAASYRAARPADLLRAGGD